MKAYFDTSVVVAMTLQETRWIHLGRWIVKTMPRPFYSDYGWGEYISAIGLKVRRGELTAAQGSDTIAAVADYLGSWSRVGTTRRDLQHAAEMVASFHLGLRFPDAIHIASAARLGCTLISGDHKQLEAARIFGCTAVNPYLEKELSP